MKLESPPVESNQGSGVGGVARLIAVCGVLAFAALGILMVLGVIPVDALGDFATKALGVAAIALVASLAIGLLSRR